MIYKFSYVQILSGNFVLLCLLMFAWTDQVEQIYNEYVREIQIFAIVFLSVVMQILLYLTLRYFKSKAISSRRLQINFAIAIILSISSPLYIQYASKIVQNGIYYSAIRNSILAKTEGNLNSQNPFLVCRSTQPFTLEEYQLIQSMNWFPDISNFAKNVEFIYTTSGFDYHFRVSYEVPRRIQIKEFNHDKRSTIDNLQVELLGKTKRVTHQQGIH